MSIFFLYFLWFSFPPGSGIIMLLMTHAILEALLISLANIALSLNALIVDLKLHSAFFFSFSHIFIVLIK